MSHFTSVEVQYKSTDALVEALVKCGFTKDQIEVHAKPIAMRDYHGKSTKYVHRDTGDARFRDGDKAHVIVRAAHVGHASNDMGWYIEKDGTGREIICDYDRGGSDHLRNSQMRSLGVDGWTQKLKAEYAAAQTTRMFHSQGRIVERVDEPDGNIHIFARG